MHHSKGRRRNVKVGGKKDFFLAESSLTAGETLATSNGDRRLLNQDAILPDVTKAILLLND